MDTIDNENSGEVTTLAVSYMRSASVWMKFISIIFFIASGFAVIGTLVLMSQSFTMGLIYAVFTAILLYTTVLLFTMGKNLATYASSPNSVTLESYFKANKRYFTIWGILLSIYILMILIMIAVGGDMMRTLMQGFAGGMR